MEPRLNTEKKQPGLPGLRLICALFLESGLRKNRISTAMSVSAALGGPLFIAGQGAGPTTHFIKKRISLSPPPFPVMIICMVCLKAAICFRRSPVITLSLRVLGMTMKTRANARPWWARIQIAWLLICCCSY